MKKWTKNILFLVFTVVFFLCLYFGLDLIFRRAGVNTLNDVLAVVGLVLALIASVGLAELVVRRIKQYREKRNA